MNRPLQVLASIVPIAIIGILVCDSIKADKDFSENIYKYNKECITKAVRILKGDNSSK